MRRLVVLLALTLVPTPAAAAPVWQRPVDGAVVRWFDPPASRFGAGHLGVDLAAAPGTPVRAAGAGTVTYAGRIGAAAHVVVAHDGDLRTSYSFLAEVSVRRGARVRAGEVVGTAGGTGRNHNGNVVHLGLRRGDDYIDPMVLYRAVDLAEVVHLAPVTDPLFHLPAAERRSLLAGLAHGALDIVRDPAGLLRTAGAVARPVGELLYVVGAEVAPIVRAALERAPGLPAAPLLVRALRLGYSWAQERARCDDGARPADGTGGSGHRVLVVAGLASASESGPPVALPTERLGYAQEEVTYFSYAPGPRYGRSDTYAPLIESAHRLAAQLRALQRAEPGREVDLVAHSQGGVIVLAFLQLLYEPGDPSYPPLGTVVTFASPLDGAPLAAVAREVGGEIGLAPAVRDLAPGSHLMQRLAATELPGTIELTTIGASTDVVVPGNVATTDGAAHTVVFSGWSAHSSIVTDDDALRAARAALERRDALPCRDFLTFAGGELLPPVVTELTYGLGDAFDALDAVPAP